MSWPSAQAKKASAALSLDAARLGEPAGGWALTAPGTQTLAATAREYQMAISTFVDRDRRVAVMALSCALGSPTDARVCPGRSAALNAPGALPPIGLVDWPIRLSGTGGW